MTKISESLAAVRERVRKAAAEAQRDVRSIRLLAVRKTWQAECMSQAIAAGQRDFGENHVQDGVKHIFAVNNPALEWHFVGSLQSDKSRMVAEHFQWVHRVDCIKQAHRLSAMRPSALPPLNICLQVNISGEVSSYGVIPYEVAELAHQVSVLPRLRLRGLMCIPEITAENTVVRQCFAAVRHLRDDLNEAGLALDTLSMGMSDDLEIAIMEGATIVRMGDAVFD